MKRHFFPFAVASLAATFTSCLTQDQTFILNPDGSGKLELALWAQNLTNVTYNYFDFRIAGRQTSRIYNDPRTFGVQARVRF